jgi:KDO2-lipid IV(A) lauroyltransferase
MERVKRGYYVIHIEPFAQDAALLPEFEATNTYYRLLTENIRQTPELWLWTHKRWKRTREGYARREAKRIEDRRKLAEKARNNV